MIKFTRQTIVFALATVGLVGAVHADALQDRVLATARATRSDIYAFRRTIAIERTGAARQVFVEQFDPRKPAAQAWALVSVDGHAPAEKDLSSWRKGDRGPVPSYNQLAKWFGAPATRSDGPAGYVTYRFARLPAGALKIGSHDASADTQAEAVVNVQGKLPYVERVRLVSTKSFRMMLVASVQSMATSGHYRLQADGAPVPAESNSRIIGSLFGKDQTIQASATYSDFQKVR
jgi:hypothetical protein